MEELRQLFDTVYGYVFIVWDCSPYYSTPMLVVRLLQKIGKEIMKRCGKHINVDRVFSGFIISTKKNIDESILCCEEWKDGYTSLVSALSQHSTVQALPEGAGIFTQIDAFMQRCRDLQDIADCQAQFARWLDDDDDDDDDDDNKVAGRREGACAEHRGRGVASEQRAGEHREDLRQVPSEPV